MTFADQPFYNVSLIVTLAHGSQGVVVGTFSLSDLLLRGVQENQPVQLCFYGMEHIKEDKK